MLSKLKSFLRKNKFKGVYAALAEEPTKEVLDLALARLIREGEITLLNTQQMYEAKPSSVPLIGQYAPSEKGEFLPDMTEAEALEYERNERDGWKNFKISK